MLNLHDKIKSFLLFIKLYFVWYIPRWSLSKYYVGLFLLRLRDLAGTGALSETWLQVVNMKAPWGQLNSIRGHLI